MPQLVFSQIIDKFFVNFRQKTEGYGQIGKKSQTHCANYDKVILWI
jgi:hypothetical protein